MDVTLSAASETRIPFIPWKPKMGKVFEGSFAFDCETTLIDKEHPWLTPVYVLGAASDGQKGYFISRDKVEEFFRCHDEPTHQIIFHNAAFDLRVLSVVCPTVDFYRRVDTDRVWDTYLMHRSACLGEEGHTARGKGQATLETCAERYLGIDLPKDTEDAQGDVVRLSYGKWLNRPLKEIEPVYLEYSAKDALATYLVYERLMERLADIVVMNEGAFGYGPDSYENILKYGFQTHHIQIKASIVLDRITANGLCIDAKTRDDLVAQLGIVKEEYDKKLLAYDYSSGKGSGNALQNIMADIEKENSGLSFPKTAKGKYSTTGNTLKKLGIDHPFLTVYQESNAVKKLLSTYLEKMNKPMLHPSFDVLLTSGRTSSFGDINAQNLPRDDRIRACFVPSEGHVFIAADYATLEMATLAQCVLTIYGGESAMAQMINEGRDLHRAVAAKMTGKAEAEVTKEERQKAKAVNFGKPGGMGDRGLEKYAESSYGIKLTEEEVEQLTQAWFDLFPEMRRFLENPFSPGFLMAEYFDLNWDNYNTALGLPFSQESTIENLTILGWMCLKVMAAEYPEFRNGSPYGSGAINYFWRQVQSRLEELPADLREDIRAQNASADLREKLIDFLDAEPAWTLTGRLRANVGYTQRHNTVFQGLAADGAKIASWKLLRAGYRIVNFMHDEFLIEVPEGSDLKAHAETIRQIMIEAMREVVPDVRIDVQYAAMKRWYKSAEAVFDEAGKLIPWEPDSEEADNKGIAEPDVPAAISEARIEAITDLSSFQNQAAETFAATELSNGERSDPNAAKVQVEMAKTLILALEEHVDEIEEEVSDSLGDRGLILLDEDGDLENPVCTDLQIMETTSVEVEGNQFRAVLDCNIQAEAEASFDDPGTFIFDAEDRVAHHDTMRGIARADFREPVVVTGEFDDSDPSSIEIHAIIGTTDDVEFEIDPDADMIPPD